VVPFFGWGVGIMVAVALLIAILIMCWLLCFGALINLLPWTGWPSKKAHDNQETRQ
jgi:fatty acid desaturase